MSINQSPVGTYFSFSSISHDTSNDEMYPSLHAYESISIVQITGVESMSQVLCTDLIQSINNNNKF